MMSSGEISGRACEVSAIKRASDAVGEPRARGTGEDVFRWRSCCDAWRAIRSFIVFAGCTLKNGHTFDKF